MNMATTGASSILNDHLDTNVQDYLSFTLGKEEYGIPILTVQEIIGFQEPTTLPDVPDWILGVVNIRGTVIPVVDVRRQFGMEYKAVDDLSVIIIAQVKGRIIGTLVDKVNDVLSFNPEQIQDPPQVSDKVQVHYITGLGKLDERLVLFMDLDEVLDGAATHLPTHEELQRGAQERKSARSKGEPQARTESGAEARTKVKTEAKTEAKTGTPPEAVTGPASEPKSKGKRKTQAKGKTRAKQEKAETVTAPEVTENTPDTPSETSSNEDDLLTDF